MTDVEQERIYIWMRKTWNVDEFVFGHSPINSRGRSCDERPRQVNIPVAESSGLLCHPKRWQNMLKLPQRQVKDIQPNIHGNRHN